MFRSVAVAVALVVSCACCATSVTAATTPTSVQLTWTAPGDDGLSGTATQYDVRVSTSVITEGNFAAATRVSGAPVPAVSGSVQAMDVTGLTPSTTYWFAIKTADDAGNWSAISNMVSWTTAASSDTIRPATPVVNVSATTDHTVTLAWSAVGDDSLSGTADHYEVRWSTNAITSGNWASAILVSAGVPTPGASGTAENATVTGLDRTVDLYFAVRVYDDMGNASAVASSPRVDHLLDTAPPATPASVAAAPASGDVHVTWSANSEPDLAGYHVYRAVAAAGPFVRIDVSTVITNDYTDTTAPDSASLWYAVTAVDGTGNESARSAGTRVTLHAANVTAWKLQPSYPNPSRGSDTVTFPIEVPVTGPFSGRVDILNGAGERIRSIELRSLSPGNSTITWDGRNDAGRNVAPGVYRAWLQVGDAKQQVKLVRQP